MVRIPFSYPYLYLVSWLRLMEGSLPLAEPTLSPPVDIDLLRSMYSMCVLKRSVYL